MASTAALSLLINARPWVTLGVSIPDCIPAPPVPGPTVATRGAAESVGHAPACRPCPGSAPARRSAERPPWTAGGFPGASRPAIRQIAGFRRPPAPRPHYRRHAAGLGRRIDRRHTLDDGRRQHVRRSGDRRLHLGAQFPDLALEFRPPELGDALLEGRHLLRLGEFASSSSSWSVLTVSDISMASVTCRQPLPLEEARIGRVVRGTRQLRGQVAAHLFGHKAGGALDHDVEVALMWSFLLNCMFQR